MMSQIPIDLTKIKKEDVGKEILRAGIITELEEGKEEVEEILEGKA